MNNSEPILSFLVAHDSLLILFITIIMTVVFNFYLRVYLSLVYRVVPTWLFAYIFSLAFVRLYDNWLGEKVDYYADFGGFIFSTGPDAPIKPPEFSVYWEALYDDTWRNMYFLTGIVITFLAAIMIEVLLSIVITIKNKFIENIT